MTNSLRQVLDQQYANLMFRQAESIRDWHSGKERHEQAEIHVRLALWEQGMGRITLDTQCRIYSILSFVMPGDAAFEDESTPLEELEREAAWETAYHEQLERRSCPECGDENCSAREQS